MWISERESFKHLVLNGGYNIMVHRRQSAWLLGELGIKVTHRLLSFLLTREKNTSLNTRHLSQIGNFTSDGLSVPEEVPKHLQKLSRNMAKNSGMLEKTDSEFVTVVALLCSKVSISPTSGRQIYLYVTATNDALQSTCLTLCYVERFYPSSESTAHYFRTHLLSDYFLRMSAVMRIFPCCQLL